MVENGELLVACGITRSGKTVWAKEQARRFTDVIIWDPDHQHTYPSEDRAMKPGVLLDALERAQAGSDGVVPVVFTGGLAYFGFFCEAAFAHGRILANKDRRLCVVVEETADVTSPGKAPAEWGVLIRRALKYGITVIAITQRPSESDKTSFANASLIHCCKVHRQQDVKYMAGEMACDPAEITGMVMSDAGPALDKKLTGRYDFVEWRPGTGEFSRGSLSFDTQGKPHFLDRKAQ